MTTKYSEEFKARIIARLLPPNNVRVHEVTQETEIVTLNPLKTRHGKTGSVTTKAA
jgi:transposase-like protein